MRRKYFMRGMGLGIIITALIFTISSFFTNGTMSRSEIIAEAKKLGMVMQDADTLENTDNKDNDNTDNNNKANESDNTLESSEEQTGEKKSVVNLTGDEVSPAPNETTDPTTEANENAPSEDSNAVSFQIRSGEDSLIVSANLYKAGLIKNPTEYNTYLEKNGYDKLLRTGNYKIVPGSSDESIAKKLTGK